MTNQFMIIKRPLGEKGQVVIPKDIRKLLGLQNGKSEVVFEIRDNKVTITPNKSEDFIKEFLKHRRKRKEITLEELKKIEDESYDLP